MAMQFLQWLWWPKPTGRGLSTPIFQLIIFLCGMFGLAYLTAGSFHWWNEQFYVAEGVHTDTGVVLGKWQEKRDGSEGGTITETFLRYHYADQSGQFHEHLKKSKYERWDKLSVGSQLPTIEYLASAPRAHRYASEKGLGRIFFWLGLGLLAAIIPIRLAFGAAIRQG